MFKKAICIICALMCVTLCRCRADENQGKLTNTDAAEYLEPSGVGLRKTVLYYQDANGYILPIMKQIPWEEGIGKAALNYLKANDANNESAAIMGLTAAVPADVEFGLRINDDMCAIVNINNAPEFEDPAAERAMVTAIVNTLVEFPTIQTVKIIVNGKETDKLPAGMRVDGTFECMKMNVENGELATSGSAHCMQLYFSNVSGSLNIPVTRYLDGMPTYHQAVEALIEGPQMDNLICCFPDGTKVLSAYIEDEVAVVDLSAAFTAVEYTEGLLQTACETLYLTAQEFADVGGLKLLVEGVQYNITADLPLFANQFR